MQTIMEMTQTDYDTMLAACPYHRDGAEVAAMTGALVAAGQRIHQIFRFDDDDVLHVAALLGCARFPAQAKILDVGCGVGEVSRLIEEVAPGYRCTLQNVSAEQLDLAPEHLPRIVSDMHAIPADDRAFDAIMVNYALGHADPRQAMAEFARLLRPGGVLFVYDIACSDPARMAAGLGYFPHDPITVLAAAEQAGFVRAECEDLEAVADMSAFFCDLADADARLRELAADMRPVAYRFVRQGRRMLYNEAAEAAGVKEWVQERMPYLVVWPDGVAIGVERDGDIIGGVVYEDSTPCNVNMHCAGEGYWMTREAMRAFFIVPFLEWGKRRVTGLVPAGNDPMLRMMGHLGFTQEGYCRDAFPDDDLVIFGMRRDECKFIRGNEYQGAKYG